MPLSSVSLIIDLQWTQYKSNAPYANTTQSDVIAFTLANLNLANWQQIFVDDITAGAGASVTLDLTALTNDVGESFTCEAFLCLVAVSGTNAWSITPGSTNPLPVFGSGGQLQVPAAGATAFSYAPTSTGLAVSSTAKTIKFTNNGSSTDTLSVGIVGSTTL